MTRTLPTAIRGKLEMIPWHASLIMRMHAHSEQRVTFAAWWI